MGQSVSVPIASLPQRPSPALVRRLLLVLVLVAWEALPRLGLVPPVIVAPLSATVMAAIHDAGTFADALGATCTAIVLALLIAYGGGGVCGLILSTIRPLRLTVLPLIASIYAVPFIVIYPMLTAWMGIGPQSQIWFAGMYGFFPMVLATAAGSDLVNMTHVLAARSMGASRMQILLHIVIPSTLPAITSGLRLAGALVAIGVVAAEMLTSTSGIGFLITQNRTMFRTPDVYLGIFLVLIIAGVLDRGIGAIEKMISRRMGRRLRIS
jgi:NitT/TauT family transport system permease protein